MGEVNCVSVWQEGGGPHGNGVLVQYWSGSAWITVWHFGENIPNSQWVRIPNDTPSELHMTKMNWVLLGFYLGLGISLLICLCVTYWLTRRISQQTKSILPSFIGDARRYFPTTEQVKFSSRSEVVVSVAVKPMCA